MCIYIEFSLKVVAGMLVSKPGVNVAVGFRPITFVCFLYAIIYTFCLAIDSVVH